MKGVAYGIDGLVAHAFEVAFRTRIKAYFGARTAIEPVDFKGLYVLGISGLPGVHAKFRNRIAPNGQCRTGEGRAYMHHDRIVGDQHLCLPHYIGRLIDVETAAKRK